MKQYNIKTKNNLYKTAILQWDNYDENKMLQREA